MKSPAGRSVAAAACAGAVIAIAGLPAAPAGAGQAAAPSQHARQDVGGPRLASHGIVVNYPPGHRHRLPKIPAAAYVLADANNDEVLAAKDAHGEYAPASTLKVLTAITLIPLLNPNATAVATRRATSVVPNVVGLIRGRRYKISDLFRALLLISANDAAVALVQATGSFRHGMALLNTEARQLQAYDVVAKQPNGLPAPGQHVSAYDLALIARQALRIPAFMKYDSTLAARFPIKRHHKVTLVNQNYLLTEYRGGIGGKIGWTERAHATYIGLARRHGVTLIVTLLHCTPLEEITSGERLLNWGFKMAGKVRPVGVLVPPLLAVQHVHQGPGQAHRGAATPAASPAHAATAATSAGSAMSAVPIAVGAGLIAIAGLALGWLTRLRRRPR
jgi:serine-type D-Ala-D-Ala carboxypeptidase (penicillin-binding protein 5/6)